MKKTYSEFGERLVHKLFFYVCIFGERWRDECEREMGVTMGLLRVK